MNTLEKFRAGQIRDGMQDVLRPLLLVVLMIAGYGLAILLLWNWVMPAWIDAPAITYLQSCGVVAITHLLFKSNPLRQKSRFDYEAIPVLKKLIRLAINESKLVGDPPTPGLRRSGSV